MWKTEQFFLEHFDDTPVNVYFGDEKWVCCYFLTALYAYMVCICSNIQLQLTLNFERPFLSPVKCKGKKEGSSPCKEKNMCTPNPNMR